MNNELSERDEERLKEILSEMRKLWEKLDGTGCVLGHELTKTDSGVQFSLPFTDVHIGNELRLVVNPETNEITLNYIYGHCPQGIAKINIDGLDRLALIALTVTD